MKPLPTWLCNMCSGEFKFTPITVITKAEIGKEDPHFCPYCGRENTILAQRRTTFKKIGILDAEDLEKLEKEQEIPEVK